MNQGAYNLQDHRTREWIVFLAICKFIVESEAPALEKYRTTGGLKPRQVVRNSSKFLSY
jgi:hypothetical protein